MRTVFWADNKVKMIDQRILPGQFAIVEFDTVAAVAASIRDMVVRGAPAIGATGAYGMALAAQNSPAQERDSLLVDLRTAKTILDTARPTAVNLSWATARLLALAEATVLPNVDDLRSALLAEAEALADEDVAINRRMGFNGAALIPNGANLLHHCNTGALAAVDFGTALGVVFACQEQGKQIHVWVDETRPRLQGARLTAWELMRAGVPMHLIADNAAGMLMRTGKVDAVIFGADRVAANGDVANKVGSYKLAVVARENAIPVYSVVPTSTVDLNLSDGDHIPIEESAIRREVTHIEGVAIAPEGVPVYNPAFDVTPHKYLTAIVTEEGVCYPPFNASLRAAKAAAEARVQTNRREQGSRMNRLRSVCVFCGSSSGGKDHYRLAAEHLGRELVNRGIRLVYGAGSVGLMGVVAHTVYDRGGEVLGIIPTALAPQEMAGASIGETIVVENMHERKALMAEEADGFITMPGGFGTLDELSEMITWGQLGIQRKPIGIFNVAGFFDPLLQWIDLAVKEGFIRPQYRQLFVVTDDPSLLLERLALQQLPTGILQTGHEVDLR